MTTTTTEIDPHGPIDADFARAVYDRMSRTHYDTVDYTYGITVGDWGSGHSHGLRDALTSLASNGIRHEDLAGLSNGEMGTKIVEAMNATPHVTWYPDRDFQAALADAVRQAIKEQYAETHPVPTLGQEVAGGFRVGQLVRLRDARHRSHGFLEPGDEARVTSRDECRANGWSFTMIGEAYEDSVWVKHPRLDHADYFHASMLETVEEVHVDPSTETRDDYPEAAGAWCSGYPLTLQNLRWWADNDSLTHICATVDGQADWLRSNESSWREERPDRHNGFWIYAWNTEGAAKVFLGEVMKYKRGRLARVQPEWPETPAGSSISTITCLENLRWWADNDSKTVVPETWEGLARDGEVRAGGPAAAREQFLDPARPHSSMISVPMEVRGNREYLEQVLAYKRARLARLERPNVGTETPADEPISEVEALRRQVRLAERQRDSAINGMLQAVRNEADRRSWCSEYEDWLDNVEREGFLPDTIDLDDFRRLNDYEVTWDQEITVTVRRSATVSARNGDSAIEEVQESDYEDGLSTEDIVNAVREGNWEHDSDDNWQYYSA